MIDPTLSCDLSGLFRHLSCPCSALNTAVIRPELPAICVSVYAGHLSAVFTTSHHLLLLLLALRSYNIDYLMASVGVSLHNHLPGYSHNIHNRRCIVLLDMMHYSTLELVLEEDFIMERAFDHALDRFVECCKLSGVQHSTVQSARERDGGTQQ